MLRARLSLEEEELRKVGSVVPRELLQAAPELMTVCLPILQCQEPERSKAMRKMVESHAAMVELVERHIDKCKSLAVQSLTQMTATVERA